MALKGGISTKKRGALCPFLPPSPPSDPLPPPLGGISCFSRQKIRQLCFAYSDIYQIILILVLRCPPAQNELPSSETTRKDSSTRVRDIIEKKSEKAGMSLLENRIWRGFRMTKVIIFGLVITKQQLIEKREREDTGGAL